MRKIKGKVISTKMAKTAVVEAERFKTHPLYKKRLKIRKKFHVHDEIGVKEGDWVVINECRPISRTKYWKIIKIFPKEAADDSAKKRS